MCKSKLPKTKIFGKKRYGLVGAEVGPVKPKKTSWKKWAEYQRNINNNSVRIVKVFGGYAAYMRKRS